MVFKLVFLCFLVLNLELVYCQHSSATCSPPGVFSFESDGGNVYGKIVLPPSQTLSTLVIRINFTIAAQVFDNYAGRIEAQDGNSLLQKYNRGQAVTYRVHFPVTSPLPKLTALTVNGNTVCYGRGDSVRPNSYVTTLSLEHSSFLQTGNRIVYTNIPQRLPERLPMPPPSQNIPESLQDLVNNFADDGSAQIYTFNNIEPTWNTGPYYVVNNTRPFSQSTGPMYQPPTQQVFQPSRPVFNQNLEPYDVTTEKPVYPIRPPSRPNRPQNRPLPEEQYEIPNRERPRPSKRPPQMRPQIEPAEEYRDRVVTSPTPVISKRPPNQQVDNSITSDCGTIAGGNDNVGLIYNGESYDRGELPWLVALYRTQGGALKFMCGGTLVSNRHVITAGHCLQSRAQRTDIKDIVVKVGVHNLNDWSDEIIQTRTLIAATVHEEYRAAPLKNDITVLTFNKRVEFNQFIRPACLWNGNTDQSQIIGDTGVVAGWGDQSPGGAGRLGEPNRVRIPIVSTTTCRASKPSFHPITSETTFCAGNRDGAGPCIGDSGGGLYLLENGKWRVRGIVSVSLRAANGDPTCNLDEYIVFTDTAQYLPWIRKLLTQSFFD